MNSVPEPTEMINAPRSSWLPMLIAAGFAGLIVGLFTWWPYAVIGAAVLVIAKIAFLRAGQRDLRRLPRSQPLSTAPIPLQKSK